MVDQRNPGMDAPFTTESFGAIHSFPRESMYANRCVSCMLRPSGSQRAMTSPLKRPKFAAMSGSLETGRFWFSGATVIMEHGTRRSKRLEKKSKLPGGRCLTCLSHLVLLD